MKRNLLLFLLLNSSIYSFGQSDMNVYPDQSMFLQLEARDDGYLIAADWNTISCMDSEGTVIWTHFSPYYSHDAMIFFLNDDHSITYFFRGQNEVGICELNEFGEENWAHIYTIDELVFPFILDTLTENSVTRQPDGTFSLAVASYNCFEDGEKKLYKFDIDEDGALLNMRTYAPEEFGIDEFEPWESKIASTPAGTLLRNNSEIWLLNDDGDPVEIYDADVAGVQSVIPVSDGILVIGIHEIEKLDFEGNFKWSKGVSSYMSLFMNETDDGTLHFISVDIDYPGYECKLFTLDLASGDLLSESGFLDPAEQLFAACGIYYSDEQIILAGTTNYIAFLLLTDINFIFPNTSISGKVYFDANENLLYDGGEPKVNHALVKIPAMDAYDFTDESGAFQISSYSETETELSYFPIPDLYQSSPIDGASIIIPGSTEYEELDNQNFGVQFTNPGLNISVDFYPYGSVPGFENLLGTVFLTNEGDEMWSGPLTIELPEILEVIGTTPGFDLLEASTITFDVIALDVFEQRTYDIYVFTPLEVEIGDTLPVHTFVPEADDINPLNNSFADTIIAAESYDPNHKSVIPEGESEWGLIDIGTEWLEYTIQFENMGTSNTHFVVVTDALDPHLNPSTLTMIASSVPDYQMEFDGENIKWTFSDLQLTPQSEDPLHSKGFIIYRVAINPGSIAGTTIYNTANIYFDFNEAIVTNTTVTTLVTAIPEETGGTITIFPNPATSYVQVDVSDISSGSFVVTDMIGRAVIQGKIKDQMFAFINLENLPAGIYQMVLYDDHSKIKRSGSFMIGSSDQNVIQGD